MFRGKQPKLRLVCNSSANRSVFHPKNQFSVGHFLVSSKLSSHSNYKRGVASVTFCEPQHQLNFFLGRIRHCTITGNEMCLKSRIFYCFFYSILVPWVNHFYDLFMKTAFSASSLSGEKKLVEIGLKDKKLLSKQMWDRWKNSPRIWRHIPSSFLLTVTGTVTGSKYYLRRHLCTVYALQYLSTTRHRCWQNKIDQW